MTPLVEPQDTREITDVISLEQIDHVVNKRSSDWPKYAVLLLSIIASVVGVAIWATGAHASIRDWTAEQDFVTKAELRDVMKEQYVPLHEFTKVQQCLEDQSRQFEKIEIKLDKVLDQLHTQASSRNRR